MKIFNTIEEWNDILDQSNKEPVLVLKHSNTCPVSAKGYAEVEKFSKENPAVKVFVLIVQDALELKQQIAEEVDIVHESPQILFLKDRKVVYSANHHDITVEKLQHSIKS